jgi:hypothetical protein
MIGLIGGLFHHHESARKMAACAYCHAGSQLSAPDLARTLASPIFGILGAAPVPPVSRFTPVLPASTKVLDRLQIATPPMALWDGSAFVASDSGSNSPRLLVLERIEGA